MPQLGHYFFMKRSIVEGGRGGGDGSRFIVLGYLATGIIVLDPLWIDRVIDRCTPLMLSYLLPHLIDHSPN